MDNPMTTSAPQEPIVQDAAAPPPLLTSVAEAALDPETSQVLLRMYLTQRLKQQMKWYQARAMEYEVNSDKVFRYGALIISLTTILAALGTGNLAEFLAAIGISNISAEIRILTAILPAIAALMTSISQLYNWDRQAKLYRDTIMGLERAQLILPTLDKIDPVTAQRIYPQLVQQAEAVFEREADQWGQIALGGGEDPNVDPVVVFATQFGIDIFEADGSINPDKLGNLKVILNAAKTPPPPASAALNIQQLETLNTENTVPADAKTAEETSAKAGSPASDAAAKSTNGNGHSAGVVPAAPNGEAPTAQLETSAKP
jgi:hypothetical protein